jgi:hypothetical protein
MPQMSGFELLSVVRRRFPEILVVASSGAYDASEIPSGVIADAFYAKGQENSSELLELLPDCSAQAAQTIKEKMLLCGFLEMVEIIMANHSSSPVPNA